MRPSALLVLGLLGAACSSRPSPGTQKLPDGTISLTCSTPLAQCLSRAEDVCKDENYEVLRARDQRDTYGPELGTSQVQVRSSEAIIRCTGTGKPLGGRDPLTASASAAPPAVAPAPAVRACVPGTTQACIGPGKCEGGQSCLPDGSAFGPCDCGTLGAPVTAPPAAAAPPSDAAPPAPPPAAPGAKPAPPPPSTAAPGVVPATPLKK